MFANANRNSSMAQPLVENCVDKHTGSGFLCFKISEVKPTIVPSNCFRLQIQSVIQKTISQDDTYADTDIIQQMNASTDQKKNQYNKLLELKAVPLLITTQHSSFLKWQVVILNTTNQLAVLSMQWLEIKVNHLDPCAYSPMI